MRAFDRKLATLLPADNAGHGQARQSFSLKESPMKRLHVHVAVQDLSQSIGFYSALFD